jgi:hypothetical protein
MRRAAEFNFCLASTGKNFYRFFAGVVNMSPHLSVVRILLLTVTVAASPLGRLQLCGSALADKLAEICAVQGYNDPFRHNMYYGECCTNRTPSVALRCA